MSQFIRGQRWLCDRQPELGLGIVEGVAPRQVQLRFPATGECRTFATAEAPLSRALFAPGDTIRDQAGVDWTVTGTEAADGLVTYQVRGVDGRTGRVPEGALDARLRLNRPAQRLLGARLDGQHWFRLRRAAWGYLAAAAGSPVFGLQGARVSLIPHQLYIAAEVAGRAAPRVLLADEVGLGKTIEAGLILHRLLLTGQVRRVLVLVPAVLLHQWLVELLRRFNLRFALFDQATLEGLADGDNPFDGEQRVLCSPDLLTASPAARRAALAAGWDLLIVDEAHHLHWSPTGGDVGYDLVAALAAATPAMLLLTATPEQLGRAGHFGRLRLLDPERFGDYDRFLAEEARYAPVAEIAARLLDGLALDQTQQARLAELLGAEATGLTPEELVRRLLDRHGTSRVLFRNTRHAIPGFPVRRLHPAPLTGAPAAYLATPWPERAWGDTVPADDPRLPWLVATLRRLRPAKVLLITATAATVRALRRALAQQAGITAAVFHEGMEIVERDRAAAYFAAREDGTQVLLCSEIGSEGRNFQFVQHLILFDLPLDPDLLEQRIGRLDRIGQQGAVELHVPYLAGGAGEVLFRWYADGLAAFTAPQPAAGAVYGRLGARLHALLGPAVVGPTPAPRLAPEAEPPPASDTLTALLADAAALRATLGAALAAARDRLRELGSHRPALAADLVAAVAAADQDPAPRRWLEDFWDAFGVEHEPGRAGSTVLRPGAHMLEEAFPGLPEDGLTVCWDRAHALAHEDQALLTLEHPLARAALDYVTGGTLGSTAIWLTRHPDFPAGSLLLEVIAIADCPAPPALGAGRFLPPTPARWLLDTDGGDHADTLDPDALPGRCLHGNPPLARALLDARRGAVTAILAALEPLLTARLATLRAAALAHMEAELDGELARLRALALVNPNVRAAELTALAGRREALGAALAQARLRLDALRLIVFG